MSVTRTSQKPRLWFVHLERNSKETKITLQMKLKKPVLEYFSSAFQSTWQKCTTRTRTQYLSFIGKTELMAYDCFKNEGNGLYPKTCRVRRSDFASFAARADRASSRAFFIENPKSRLKLETLKILDVCISLWMFVDWLTQNLRNRKVLYSWQ